jgi:hypothetical protein
MRDRLTISEEASLAHTALNYWLADNPRPFDLHHAVLTILWREVEPDAEWLAVSGASKETASQSLLISAMARTIAHSEGPWWATNRERGNQ